jgi:hypothetical protein
MELLADGQLTNACKRATRRPRAGGKRSEHNERALDKRTGQGKLRARRPARHQRRNRRQAVNALLGLAIAHWELDDTRAAVELYGAFQGVCDVTGIDPATDWINTLATAFLDRARPELDPATIEADAGNKNASAPSSLPPAGEAGSLSDPVRGGELSA